LISNPLQSCCKWIIIYQDHLNKVAAKVAFQLADIFLLLGAPAVLQSENGSGFIVSEYCAEDCVARSKVVHGKPRYI